MKLTQIIKTVKELQMIKSSDDIVSLFVNYPIMKNSLFSI